MIGLPALVRMIGNLFPGPIRYALKFFALILALCGIAGTLVYAAKLVTTWVDLQQHNVAPVEAVTRGANSGHFETFTSAEIRARRQVPGLKREMVQTINSGESAANPVSVASPNDFISAWNAVEKALSALRGADRSVSRKTDH